MCQATHRAVSEPRGMGPAVTAETMANHNVIQLVSFSFKCVLLDWQQRDHKFGWSASVLCKMPIVALGTS